jgi:hypothetical protein
MPLNRHFKNRSHDEDQCLRIADKKRPGFLLNPGFRFMEILKLDVRNRCFEINPPVYS